MGRNPGLQVVQPCRIAYLHRADADMIEILGVFHGALDIDRYLP